MPRQRRIDPFYLVLVDHDNKVFNVVGPMSDDTDWNKDIAELQRTGRKTNCFSVPGSELLNNIINSCSRQTGYNFSQKLIAPIPEDRSMEYTGALPKYAQKADRKKLVKILCKGDCGSTSWAEMNVNYPGQEALRNSDLGDYNAVCLKCRKVAKDSYNWHR